MDQMPTASSTETRPTNVALATIPRRHDLDALRAIAMLLGILLHGALAYVPMGDSGWAVHDPARSEVYGIVLASIHGFRMSLFFLISGFFTAMLWRKRGLSSLLLQRFKRIFLPLVIGFFTLVPAVWITSIGAGWRSSELNSGQPVNLWDAVRGDDSAIVDELLDGGVGVDSLEPETGATPLYIASAAGKVKLAERLLDRGARVDARCRDGSTALHGAVLVGQTEAAELLLKRGADPDLRNRLGESAIDALSIHGLRLMVMAGMNGHEVDPQLDRSELAKLLTSKATDDTVPEDAPGSSEPPPRASANGVLLFLLMLFPLFHHLWFLWFLCWLVAAFAIYSMLQSAVGWRLPDWLIVTPMRYAWLVPLTMVPQSLMGRLYANFGPDTSTGILPMPAILCYYAIFFFFGAIYFDCDDRSGRLGRWWRVTLPLALLIVFPIGYELATGDLGFTNPAWLDSGWVRPASVALQAIYAWTMTFAMMGLFRSLLSRESKAMRYLSDSAYWLYLTHLPLVIVLQSVVQDWPLPSLAKLTFVCVTTSLLLLASYQLIVRYTPIGTLLNGKRTRPGRVLTT